MKITWETPTELGGAVVTEDDSSASDSADSEAPFGITDVDAHMAQKPIFRYNFRNPITDPMNVNYKFARRLEMSCFGRESIRELLMARFHPQKAQMRGEDLGTPETQAHALFATYNGVEMFKLTTKTRDMKKLKPSTLEGIMKGIVRKHQKLLHDEVKDYEAWKKAQEKAAKKAARDIED